MTSLALAHHAHAAPPPFNANFFIVTATVIPVLFLALTFQGTIFERWARAAYTGPPIVVVLLAQTFGLVMTSGTAGEIFAIYALYRQQANSAIQQATLVSVIILVAATGAVSFITGLTARIRAAGTPADSSGIPDTEPQPEGG